MPPGSRSDAIASRGRSLSRLPYGRIGSKVSWVWLGSSSAASRNEGRYPSIETLIWNRDYTRSCGKSQLVVAGMGVDRVKAIRDATHDRRGVRTRAGRRVMTTDAVETGAVATRRGQLNEESGPMYATSQEGHQMVATLGRGDGRSSDRTGVKPFGHA